MRVCKWNKREIGRVLEVSLLVLATVFLVEHLPFQLIVAVCPMRKCFRRKVREIILKDSRTEECMKRFNSTTFPNNIN